MKQKAFELRILGSTDLIGPVPGAGDVIVRQPKRLALLAYLALETATGFRRRDEVIGLFWPELDQTQGRTYLRKALHAIRADLGDIIISRGGDEVRVDSSSLWCDAVALAEHARMGRYREALDLYRGELLAGLFPEGVAPEFEEWLRQNRNGLRLTAARCAWECVRMDEETGETSAAAATARRALEIAPDDEEGVRHLMTLLDKRGDRGGALRVYGDWQARLKAEYGVEPAPETRRVARSVQAARKGESHETPPTLRSVERRTLPTSPPVRAGTTSDWSASTLSNKETASTRRRLTMIAVGLAAFAALTVYGPRFIGGDERIDARSVAVFPFRTIGDATLQSSADAVAEEIITALAMDSTITARPAMRTSDPLAGNADFAGDRTGSAYAIHGALQRSTSKIRVTLRLVRMKDGTAIWAATADVDESDRIDLPRRVAQQAVVAIRREIGQHQAQARRSNRN